VTLARLGSSQNVPWASCRGESSIRTRLPLAVACAAVLSQLFALQARHSAERKLNLRFPIGR